MFESYKQSLEPLFKDFKKNLRWVCADKFSTIWQFKIHKNPFFTKPTVQRRDWPGWEVNKRPPSGGSKNKIIKIYIFNFSLPKNSTLYTMLCHIKVNSNTIELTVHTSCYCFLDLLCVSISVINWSYQTYVVTTSWLKNMAEW